MESDSENKEIRNVNGAMNPCQRPRQNPATLLSSSGVFLSTFGPAAHAVIVRMSIRQRQKRMILGTVHSRRLLLLSPLRPAGSLSGPDTGDCSS